MAMIRCTELVVSAVFVLAFVLNGCVRFGFGTGEQGASTPPSIEAGPDSRGDMGARADAPNAQDSSPAVDSLPVADSSLAADATSADGSVTNPCNLQPTDIVASGDIVLWLDAADPSTISLGAGAVRQWRSRVGTLAVVQAKNSEQPALTAAGLRGQPVVTFDGVDDWLGLADLDLQVPGYSVVALAQWDSFDGGGVLVSGAVAPGARHGTLLSAGSNSAVRFLHRVPYTDVPGGDDNLAGPDIPLSAPSVLLAVRNGSQDEMRVSVNGQEMTRSPLVDGDLNQVFDVSFGRLGYTSNSGRHLAGFIAELLILRTALAQAHQAELSAYLRGKWLGQPCP